LLDCPNPGPQANKQRIKTDNAKIFLRIALLKSDRSSDKVAGCMSYRDLPPA
jgi:hypothetical protein